MGFFFELSDVTMDGFSLIPTVPFVILGHCHNKFTEAFFFLEVRNLN